MLLSKLLCPGLCLFVSLTTLVSTGLSQGQVIRAVPLQRLGSSLATPAQTIPAQAGSAVDNGAMLPGTPTGLPQEAAVVTVKTTEDLRLEALLKAKFDRRPAAVLSAWKSAALPQSEAPAVEPAEPPQFPGTVVQQVQSILVFNLEQAPPPAVGNELLIRRAEDDAPAFRYQLLSVTGTEVSARQLPSTPAPPGEEANPASESQPLTAGQAIRVTWPIQAAPSLAAREIQAEVAQLESDVTLGNWSRVGTYLASLPPVAGDQVYERLLRALSTSVPSPEDAGAAQRLAQLKQQGQRPPESFLTPEDLVGLADASPQVLTSVDDADAADGETEMESDGDESEIAAPEVPQPAEAQPKPASARRHLRSLATLLKKVADEGYDVTPFVDRLRQGTRDLGGPDPGPRLAATELLILAGRLNDAAEFLPDAGAVPAPLQLTALQLQAQLAERQYDEKQLAEWLEKAWDTNQELLQHPDLKDAQRDQVLTRLIGLSTAIDQERGRAWLENSFREAPQRGVRILANLGTQSADMASKPNQVDEAQRLKMLRMQNQAVEEMLTVAPPEDESLLATLTLLAENWVQEGRISIEFSTENSRGGYMSIDRYGNYYWLDPDEQRRRFGGGRPQPQPIKMGDLLEIAPSDAWQNQIAAALQAEITRLQANLHLRINEEDAAFPYIERLAQTHPALARDLVHEFLRIWTQNHDPNSDRRQRNPYIYMYGFDQKAESIPLTRSKQERNLAELSSWVARIRQMPIDKVDETLLANAFTTCHSNAEVYRLERVREVFGDLTQLEPPTIAEICQTMRANLSSNWRDVRAQEAQQTNRREPEIQQEVLRGYQVASTMAREALAAAPESWELHLALACLMYDENAYAQSVKKSSEFSDRRDRAFEQFAVAAQKYNQAVLSLEANEQVTDVFDRWFYAGLGAVDLGKITAKTQPDLRQFARIRDAMAAMPQALAEAHLAKFANNLFSRMSPIKPELKFRYLRAGFEIVGDHPRAWEARNLYDYYQDLVNEIKLEARIDGSEIVGTEPFGVYVTLKHTVEIEREAGGFAKYVQNQNSMPFAFNYGRPTEDYRDKFRDSANQALGEQFEILSIVFEGADTMRSRPVSEGWRVTPYAYMLLKPRGPEVDRLGSVQLDLDFLDTSGYVVIPIESPALVIDAYNPAEPRPVTDLQVTQTLDQREASDGKLVVEVSASGKGLIPDLEDLIDLDSSDFEVVSIDDQGSLPTTFDSEGEEIQILADRSWRIEYQPREDAQAVNTFAFGKSLRPEASVKFQRYEDADLVAAEPTLTLQRSLGSTGMPWWMWGAPLAVLGLALLGLVVWQTRRPRAEVRPDFEMPADINPFTVLSLLKEIQHRNGISGAQAAELEDSIRRIETGYFADGEVRPEGDLAQVAQQWLSQVARR